LAVADHKRELGIFLDVLLALVSYLALAEFHVGMPLPAWTVQLVPAVVGIWLLLSAAIRRDFTYRLGGMAGEIRDTLAVNAFGGVLLACVALLVRDLAVSRLVLGGFPLLSAAAGILLRLVAREFVAYRRRRGLDLRHVLVVGPLQASRRLLTHVVHPDAGLRVVGVLVPPAEARSLGGQGGEPAGRPSRGSAIAQDVADAPSLLYTPQGRGVLVREMQGAPLLGTYDDLADVLHARPVDQVAVTAPLDDPGLRPAVDLATAEGKTVWLLLDDFASRLMGRDGTGHVVVLTPQHDSYSLFVKRLIDVLVAGAALLIASPVMLGCAIAIKLDDPSAPVIFRQRRVGLHGRSFFCYKFRSMVPDAERRRAELLSRNEMDGPVFKIKDDPRITRVGRILRTYSLDELPQLWNVLRGDMSLVGPRPPLPDEVREYRPEFRRRLAFRPGLTCLWQVSGRNHVDFGRWMQLDLEYVDNWSLWLDLKILLRTIPVVFFGSGM
jgi:lipopolysaccharide/colanic/teichoic acid biosynthesis glycosyltransferase